MAKDQKNHNKQVLILLRNINDAVKSLKKTTTASSVSGKGGSLSSTMGSSSSTMLGRAASWYGGKVKENFKTTFKSGMGTYIGGAYLAQSAGVAGAAAASMAGFNDPEQSAWDRKSQQAEQLGQATGSAAGAIAGGVLGSLVPVPGMTMVGMMAGSAIGGEIGRAIGEDMYREEKTHAGRIRSSLEDLVNMESYGIQVPGNVSSQRSAYAAQRSYRYQEASERAQGRADFLAGAMNGTLDTGDVNDLDVATASATGMSVNTVGEVKGKEISAEVQAALQSNTGAINELVAIMQQNRGELN